MFASTKHFFAILLKDRPKFILTALLLFLLAISWKISSSKNHFILKTQFLLPVKHVDPTPQFCKITQNIQQIRQQKGTSHINPGRQVVEELLEIVSYSPNICGENRDGERLLVIIVNTARDHFAERQLIRNTWGSVDKYKDWRVRTVFLMGQSDYCLHLENKEKEKESLISIEEKLLLKEHQGYGDIVIGAFADTYRNLTYKHLMGYKFVDEKCPEADFIIKTDDDMFVDVPAILDRRTAELEAQNSKNGNSSSKSSGELFDIYCHEYYDGPMRDVDSKWYSTWEEWPEEMYPEYCLGNDYGISMEWLKKIYSVRGQGGFFWVDDVFIMGKLREIAEKKYNESAVILTMSGNGMITDQRNNPEFIKENCEKMEAEIGWFVFLVRSDFDFGMNMECLWRRALEKANVTARFALKHVIR